MPAWPSLLQGGSCYDRAMRSLAWVAALALLPATAGAWPAAGELESAHEVSEAVAASRLRALLERGGPIPGTERAFLAEWLARLSERGLVGREPTAEERAEIESWAPRLKARRDWRVTGEACHRYNCFAWSVGARGSHLHADGDYFEQFDEFYLRYGYLPLEPGRAASEADVALWAIGGVVLHAARHVHGEFWESKLGFEGPSVRALHRLQELDGPNYGTPARFYRKATGEELARLGVVPIAPDGSQACARR